MSAPRILKVGIVGSGFIGGRHAGILKQRNDVEIVAVLDVDPSRAEALIESHELSFAKSFSEFDEMLQSSDCDAMYFCMPPFAHNGEVEKAAAAGIHVFLEKPIALNSEHAESMVNAIEAAGVKSQVGFHMRFFKGVRLLKEKIDSGVVGRPLLMSGRYWANMKASAWWKSLEHSGGQAFEQVCHVYDLSRYFFGEPKRVCGAVANLDHVSDPDYGVDDTSASLIVFENGGMVSITGSNCSLPDHYIGDFKIVCSGAQLDFHSEGDWRIKEESKVRIHNGDCVTETIDLVEDGDPYAEETEDFIRAILEDGNTVSPAREGLKTIQLIENVRDQLEMYVAAESEAASSK